MGFITVGQVIMGYEMVYTTTVPLLKRLSTYYVQAVYQVLGLQTWEKTVYFGEVCCPVSTAQKCTATVKYTINCHAWDMQGTYVKGP